MLLIEVYEVVGKGYKEEECFKEYFEGESVAIQLET